MKNNQSGIGTVVIIAIIAAVLAVAGGTYYFVSKSNKDDSAATATNQAVDSECAKLIDDKDFCKYASTVSTDRNQKVTATTTSADGKSSTMTIETDAQGNSHSTITADGTNMQTVTYNGTFYTLDTSDNTWIKYPKSENQDPASETDVDINIQEEESKPEADRTQYKSLGKEACGNLTCFKYQIIDPRDTAGEVFIWFDDQDYLTRRMQTKTAEGTMDMTYSYEDVSITEPSPVKEMPAVDANMSQEELQKLMEQYAQ